MVDLVYKLASAIGTAEGWFNPDPTVAPRRNNNPGNLTEVDPKTKKIRFQKFDKPEKGIAAEYRQICLMIARGQTLRQMISIWAPPNENNTENYIRETARRVGIDPDVPLMNYLEINRIS